MMYFWRHNPSFPSSPSDADPIQRAEARVQWVLSQASNAQKWIAIYDANKGLRNLLNREFYSNSLGMTVGGFRPDAQVYQYAFWTELLRRSPVAVNTVRRISFLETNNHVIVVWAIKHLRSVGTLVFADPATGTDKELPLSFIAAAMGFVENAGEIQFRERVITW